MAPKKESGKRDRKPAPKKADVKGSKTEPAKKQAAKSAPAKKSSRSASDNYTDPELRERIKAEIMAGDKGGKPGQWSARKAQLVAHTYTAKGGGYKHERDETQDHLKQWTEEKWKTIDGKPAIQKDATSRYLPEKAWKELTPAQQQATDRKKKVASRQGKQFVSNTEKAKAARSHAMKAARSHATKAARSHATKAD